MPKKIIFLNSHPIQYFAPMYKYMNEHDIETEAWYCSNESVKGGFDAEFGTKITWDIPLLNGYKCTFFKNYSFKPSINNGYWGLMNFGIIKDLFAQPKSVIVVHGWHYLTHTLVLLLGKLKGHTICLRCDVPLLQEQLKHGWKQKIKHFGLRYFLFPRISYFLFIGHQNKLFYKSYGILENRLLFSPYAVDNDRFNNEYKKLQPQRENIRKDYGILPEDKVILFTAKYIEKKRPLDLLKAFGKMDNDKCWLILVGEGELRSKMETFIKENNLQRVILMGFVNQSQISVYYTISDLFVMCSGEGENWGLSVNEAMNFNLPLVVSSLTGCADDLVKEGTNGYVLTTSNVDELAEKINLLLKRNLVVAGQASRTIIDMYSYKIVGENLSTIR